MVMCSTRLFKRLQICKREGYRQAILMIRESLKQKTLFITACPATEFKAWVSADLEWEVLARHHLIIYGGSST